MTGRLWVDVEDLFDYARGHPRPTGIQRLAFEICHALYVHDACGGQVQFVRHAPLRNSLRIVQWSEVAALFADLTEDRHQKAGKQQKIQTASRHGPARQMVSNLSHRLPKSVRLALIDIFLTSQEATRSWGRLALLLVRLARAAVHRAPRLPPARTSAGPALLPAESAEPAASPIGGLSGLQDFSAQVAPGDVVLALGATWTHYDYASLVSGLREKHAVRFAILVYDLIPLSRPEWFDRTLVHRFRDWMATMTPLCDEIFAISKATAADVEAYVAKRGITPQRRVMPIPIGTGVTTATTLLSAAPPSVPATPAPQAPEPAASPLALPAAGSYVLLVSTIEARKNHQLMFRVWRRLLEELPADDVPTLVFAGRIGWLVADLMNQVVNTDYLGGKLVIVEGPSDADLAALYRGCLFTVFPSFYEGWGLPVTESLALGKPCIISNRSSLPEAGGTLARYFDPDDLNDAYAAIHAVLKDRPGLQRWQDRVRREFIPVPWSATVEALMAGLAGEAVPPVRLPFPEDDRMVVAPYRAAAR